MKRRKRKKVGVRPRAVLVYGGLLAGVVTALLICQALLPALPEVYSYVPGNASLVTAVNDAGLLSKMAGDDQLSIGLQDAGLVRTINFGYNGSLFSLIELRSADSNLFTGCTAVGAQMYDCSGIVGDWYVYRLGQNLLLGADSREALESMVKLYPLRKPFSPPHPEIMKMPLAVYVNLSLGKGSSWASSDENFTLLMIGMSEQGLKILVGCRDVSTAEYYEKHYEEITSPVENTILDVGRANVRREGKLVMIEYEGNFSQYLSNAFQ